MPITIKQNLMKYKNPSTDEYQGVDVIAETTTSEQITAIQSEAAEQMGAIEAKGLATRESIPSDYTTLSDDVNDLKSAIFVREQHDFSDDTLEMWTITSGNKWGHVTTASSRCYVISVKNTQFMRVTAGTNGAVIAFLKSFNPVHNATPDFAGDYTARITLNAGDAEEYKVPADANYFYALAINSSNANTTPSVLMEYMKTDVSLTQQHIPADSYAVGERMNALDHRIEGTIKRFNAMNAIPIIFDSSTSAGVTFTSNHDGSYSVSGTSTGIAYKNLISGNGNFPYGINAGSSFVLYYNGQNVVKVQIYRYINGSLEDDPYIDFSGDWSEGHTVALGSSVTGILLRLYVPSGTTIAQSVTVMPVIMTAPSNSMLGDELVDAHAGYDGHIYSSVGNAVRGQFEGFVTPINYDFTTETLSAYTLLATGKWTHSTTGPSRSYTVRIPPNAASVKVTAGASGGVVAFFSDYEYPPTIGTLPDYTEGTSRIPLTANEVAAYTIVPGMNYLYVAAVNSSGTNVLPTVTMYIAKGSGNGGGGNTVINNTYNITTNPTITTDTNGWLQAVDTESQSETGKTDMTGPIMSMLQDTGYCHLSEGIFYVSGNIEMPANSKIEGCGFGTKIKLLDGTDATVIVMDTHCSIENLWISGSYSTLTLDGVIEARNAISYAKSTNRYGVVSNCKISGFTGSGILLMDTSTPVDKCACISNCFIENCNVGIYIRRNSEFNKITNCTIVRNYYGYFNRGGNNDIANCGIDANVVNVQIDNDEGTNGGHGTITGCSMNHANSNTGYGLIIKGTGRMIVTNCNLYYAKIRLENTNGNIISNCGFGRSAGWEISGGECSMFIGCMIRSSDDTPITISNNTDVKVINCFDRDGNSVTIS